MQLRRWHSYATPDALAEAALAAILAAARQAIAARGTFHLVLAGGMTPKKVYQKLAAADADWPSWWVYFGDERCLPVADVERNSRMADDAWLAHRPIPATQIFPIAGECGATAAAAAYALQLARVEQFDLVLLGLGEDGHTASLFPGLIEVAEQRATVAVFNAPKPPAERVSLSARRLAATRQLIFLAGGASKRAAVHAWRQGVAIPAAAIAPACGVDIYLEASALEPVA